MKYLRFSVCGSLILSIFFAALYCGYQISHDNEIGHEISDSWYEEDYHLYVSQDGSYVFYAGRYEGNLSEEQAIEQAISDALQHAAHMISLYFEYLTINVCEEEHQLIEESLYTNLHSQISLRTDGLIMVDKHIINHGNTLKSAVLLGRSECANKKIIDDIIQSMVASVEDEAQKNLLYALQNKTCNSILDRDYLKNIDPYQVINTLSLEGIQTDFQAVLSSANLSFVDAFWMEVSQQYQLSLAELKMLRTDYNEEGIFKISTTWSEDEYNTSSYRGWLSFNRSTDKRYIIPELVRKNITDLSLINTLPMLEELDISGCENLYEARLYNLPNLYQLILQGNESIKNIKLSALPLIETLSLEPYSDMKQKGITKSDDYQDLIVLEMYDFPVLKALNLEGALNLQEVYIVNCPVLIGENIKGLDSNKNLNTLVYQGSGQLASSLLQKIIEQNSIQILSLGYNDWITDNYITHLQDRTSITDLDLQSTEITSATGNYLITLTELESLNLQNLQKADANLLQSIGTLANLKTLNISANTWASGESLLQMQNNEILRTLSIGGSYLSDEDLSYISQLSQIKYLILTETDSITPEGFKVLENLPLLDTIQLFNITESITEFVLAAKSFSKLDYIIVDQCSGMDGQTLSAFTELPQLKSLILKQCINIPEIAFNSLNGIETLENIIIEGCPSFNNNALQNLSESPSLKSISIINCPIDDQGLLSLKGMEQLEELEIIQCDNISQQAIQELKEEGLSIH